MTLWFLVPGDLGTITGGYGYDRKLIGALRALGIDVRPVRLPDGFPNPSPAERTIAAGILARLPDGAVMLVDGLAYGVMADELQAEAQRLVFHALCHHPLALETGLDAETAMRLHDSEQAALALARSITVTSPATAEILVTNFGIARDRITVALPGTEKHPPAAGSGDPLRLLTVATLTRRKGHDVLLDALARIRDRRWTCEIVGGGQFDPVWAESLKLRAESLGLSHRIDFAGELPDPTVCYARADLFVLPSRFEGYGMVFAEAMAHGLPVIATRAGAIPDVVPDTAGILVPVDDARALADAIAVLIDDPVRRSMLRQGAIRAGQALPDWADCARLVASRLGLLA